MSDLCPEWECGVWGMNVCLIWLLGDSANQPLQKCVTCHDWFMSLKPYQLHLPALEISCSKSDSAEVTSMLSSVSPGWNFRCQFPDSHWSSCLEAAAQQTSFRGFLCFRASLNPGAGNHPLLERLWEPGCKMIAQVMKVFQNATFACSSALCIKQCSIKVLLFFTEVLLFFACEQHFILRILKGSINSMRVWGFVAFWQGVPLLESSLWSQGAWSLTQSSGWFAIAFSSSGLWLGVNHPRAPDSHPCASPQGHVPAPQPQWPSQKLLCARTTKLLTSADSKVTSLSWCLLLPSLLSPQPCSWVTWVQCCGVGTSVMNNQQWSIISEWIKWVGHEESPGCTQELPSAGTRKRGSSEVWALLRSRRGEHTLRNRQEPWCCSPCSE